MDLKVPSSFMKLQRTKKKLRKLCLRPVSAKFFFFYLFLYLYNKDNSINFSSKGVELVEELVINYMPIICDHNENNYKIIGIILVSMYEIYFADIKRLSNSKKNYTRTLTNFSNIFYFYLKTSHL